MFRTLRGRKQFLLLGVTLLVCLLSTLARAQNFPYTVKDLGKLPGESFATPFGLNAQGDVVGWSGFYRAFVYKDGTGMTELPALPGRAFTLARAITDGGVIVGEAWASGVANHAVRWSAGVVEDIGNGDESSKAWEINASGIVVGDSPVDALTTAGFMFTDASGAVVIEPSRTTSHAYDVSDAGQVTGTMTVGNVYHAFRFTPGVGNEDLGALPSLPGSHGKAINVSGQVTGTLYSADGNTERIFRYTNGVGMVNLGGVGSHNDPWAINARGDVVGNGRPTAGLERAFIFTDHGGLKDLNLLIDPALGLFLRYAYDINDAGQIVCFASSNIDGGWHALRLTPTTTTTHVDGGTPAIARALRVAPNPSADTVRFEYELLQSSQVEIGVYDVAGRLVRTLMNAPQNARAHSLLWDGKDQAGAAAPSGVYFFRIRAGSFSDSVKLVLVR